MPTVEQMVVKSAEPAPKPSPTPFNASSPPCSCTTNSYNCTDFDTQADAQTCFDYCLDRNAGDIHWLDGDDNGLACESMEN